MSGSRGNPLEHIDEGQGSEAFGAYLRKLRETRRLSLDAVEELSAAFPEKVTKSHLSRIENGLAPAHLSTPDGHEPDLRHADRLARRAI